MTRLDHGQLVLCPRQTLIKTGESSPWFSAPVSDIANYYVFLTIATNLCRQ